MQGKIVRAIQITMDESESELFWSVLDHAHSILPPEGQRIVSEYLETVSETFQATEPTNTSKPAKTRSI